VKYLLLLMDDDECRKRGPEERQAYMEQVGRWWGEHAQAGHIIGGEQLQGPETATTVRHTSNGPIVTDGPFIEAKETIAGYGVVEMANLDEALELAKSFPWGGTLEVRPVLERS
jgi:hypothetical protein